MRTNSISTRRWCRVALALALVVGVVHCAPPGPPGPEWSTDAEDALTPQGEALLQTLPPGQTVRALGAAQVEIDRYRKQGINALLSALKSELASKGIDSKSLDGITDDGVGAAITPPPGLSIDTSDLPPGVGSKSSGLTGAGGNGNNPDTYFECPIQAPEQTDGTPCDKLVDDVVAKVKDQVKKDNEAVRRSTEKLYGDLQADAKKFVDAWAIGAQLHGIQVASIYAKHELRAAAKCDTKANGMQISYNLGVVQGWEIGLGMMAWAITQVSKCIVNTDVVAKEVKLRALAKISAFMTEHKVCEDADISDDNVVLKKAEKRREEGIRAGIEQMTETLKTTLFKKRTKANNGCSAEIDTCNFPTKPKVRQTAKACFVEAHASRWVATKGGAFIYEGKLWDVAGLEMCCRLKGSQTKCIGNPVVGGAKEIFATLKSADCATITAKYLHVGSPVVIDLDGDGLALAERTVSFDLLADGAPVRSTWAGPGEALLALDRDGDGRISSGAELFGNASECGDRRCYDGVAALRAWDSEARGGNADGLIDGRDRVFSRLRLWRDADSDGVSTPEELSTLPAAGVRAIHLEADELHEKLPGAVVTARLSVLTSSGFRDAYDVWFHMRVAPRNLKTLAPPPR